MPDSEYLERLDDHLDDELEVAGSCGVRDTEAQTFTGGQSDIPDDTRVSDISPGDG
jgi:hypothetical protein